MGVAAGRQPGGRVGAGRVAETDHRGPSQMERWTDGDSDDGAMYCIKNETNKMLRCDAQRRNGDGAMLFYHRIATSHRNIAPSPSRF